MSDRPTRFSVICRLQLHQKAEHFYRVSEMDPKQEVCSLLCRY